MTLGRTHRPVHDDALCRACRICLRRCPAEVLSEFRDETETLRGEIYARRAGGRSGPRSLPPCQSACPLKQDVPGYLTAIAEGDLAGAIATIRETNPLPLICGWLCEQPCVRSCVRGEYDAALSIRALKRVAAQWEAGQEPTEDAVTGTPEVAIVGSGPTALAAAGALIRDGHRAVVLEASQLPGGLLATAAPTFQLPRDAVAREVEYLQRRGVEFRTGVRVGRDVRLDDLLGEYRAVLLAIGTSRFAPLGVAGEGECEVLDGVDLARAVAFGQRPNLGPRAVVVGGNGAALACARIVRRLGAEEVHLAWTGSAKRFPPLAREEAEEEGIAFHPGLEPLRILVRVGRPAGLVCRAVSSPGAADGEEVTLGADVIVAAAHGQPDLSLLGADHGLELGPGGTLTADRRSFTTARPGLFAAGGVVSGTYSVVRAVAAGQQAAAAIQRHLAGTEGAG